MSVAVKHLPSDNLPPKLNPIACKTTLDVIFEKSAAKRYRSPVLPPSRKIMWTAMSIKMRNRTGMRILLRRSIPLLTSNHSTDAVSTIAMEA